MQTTPKQKKEAYKKLPWRVQDFIMDNETTDLVESFLRDAGLSGDVEDRADSEILYAMYSMQNLSDAITEISKISGKRIDELSKLRTDLQKFIFDPIGDLYKKTSDELSTDLGGGKIKMPIDNRIRELGVKYSLTTEQVETLNNLVLEMSYNQRIKNDFVGALSEDLNISFELSKEIYADLNKRVIGQTKVADKIESLDGGEAFEKIPEIRPNILPATEKGEAAHQTTEKEKKWFEKGPFVSTKKEFVPPVSKELKEDSPTVGVPRYDEISDQKEVPEKPAQTKKEPSPQPSKKYEGKDPYREPAE